MKQAIDNTYPAITDKESFLAAIFSDHVLNDQNILSLRLMKSIEKVIRTDNEQKLKDGKIPLGQSSIDAADILKSTPKGATMISLLLLRKSNNPSAPNFNRPKYALSGDMVKQLLKDGLTKMLGEGVGDMSFIEDNLLVPASIPVKRRSIFSPII